MSFFHVIFGTPVLGTDMDEIMFGVDGLIQGEGWKEEDEHIISYVKVEIDVYIYIYMCVYVFVV